MSLQEQFMRKKSEERHKLEHNRRLGMAWQENPETLADTAIDLADEIC